VWQGKSKRQFACSLLSVIGGWYGPNKPAVKQPFAIYPPVVASIVSMASNTTLNAGAACTIEFALY
jgi:hypothetical protein